MSEDFFEGRLPVPVGLGASGGPEWRTETITLASGREVRSASWSEARRRWDVVTPPLSRSGFAALQGFFNARRGRLQGFRFADLTEFSTAAPGESVSHEDEAIGVGDGTQTVFQLVRSTESGDLQIVRKPVSGSILVGLDGVLQTSGWSVDTATGLVTFEAPPAGGVVVTAGFEFDWPVRFDTDFLETSFEQPGVGRVVTLPLVELR
ncbi:DUF2460 domain-containing protein [Henriciella litoralis]|uniref:DUF2460 domain-containing protein n=1 Tax=Henriciella litoralis TaxID=568102 RepID=UPI000A06262E|nr:DUF2460 domain-containing protein [Henriciella litoralis]